MTPRLSRRRFAATIALAPAVASSALAAPSQPPLAEAAWKRAPLPPPPVGRVWGVIENDGTRCHTCGDLSPYLTHTFPADHAGAHPIAILDFHPSEIGRLFGGIGHVRAATPALVAALPTAPHVLIRGEWRVLGGA